MEPPALFPVPRNSFTLRAGRYQLDLGPRTRVVGILNCTPDSFSDGGLFLTPSAAISRLATLVEEGADCIDLGGESTRPGAAPVAAEEEWRRIHPVLEEARRAGCPVPISVDTSKEEVAARALDAGASLINDVSGLRFAPGIADRVAAAGAGLILMHMRGEPRTMQRRPVYADLMGEVGDGLRAGLEVAMERGVAEERVILDPGIGFGKTVDHNLEILARLPELAALGRPLLIGASRKSFLGKLLGLEVGDRVEASVSAHVCAALAGAQLVRVHDVRMTVRALAVADAIRKSAATADRAASL